MPFEIIRVCPFPGGFDFNVSDDYGAVSSGIIRLSKPIAELEFTG
jgi:hypothetical protein